MLLVQTSRVRQGGVTLARLLAGPKTLQELRRRGVLSFGGYATLILVFSLYSGLVFAEQPGGQLAR